MGRRSARPRLSDASVILLGPTDYLDPSAPVPISSGVTSTLRVYDAVRRSQITADLAATGTVLLVDDTSVWTVGDSVEIRLDDTTTLHSTTIASIQDGVSVTLAAGIPASRTAERGGYLQKPIGSSVTMTIYGTPVANGTDWGYIGFVPDDVDLWDVESVREEVDFDAGAGKRLFKSREEPVVWED